MNNTLIPISVYRWRL